MAISFIKRHTAMIMKYPGVGWLQLSCLGLCLLRQCSGSSANSPPPKGYGRISDDEFILTQEQIDAFHRDGCVTIPNVLRDDEVEELANVFDKFVSGEITVPGKDFCDMSKPFGVPYEEWSLVNCMLPTKYYPPLRGNVYERLTASMAKQLFPDNEKENNPMTKDYDQLLNKRPGKSDAVFSWHQDMAYWPGSKVLNVDCTDTCTFSLAIDDSTPENGCLRYVVGSGADKVLRPHRPMAGDSRDDGHALVTDVNEEVDNVQLSPATRGSVTIHDEYVVHGSGGNNSPNKQRRTYVLAYRAAKIVQAERKLGFTHSHNDNVNWDTFDDGESHRVGSDTKKKKQPRQERDEQQQDLKQKMKKRSRNRRRSFLLPPLPTSKASSSTNTMSSSLSSQPSSPHLKPRIIQLNIMVAGLSGLGKTTMCNVLLDSWTQDKQKKTKKNAAPTTKTIHIDDTSRVYERYDENTNTMIRVRIIDTPGFGNKINHYDSIKPIRRYIQKCRNDKFLHDVYGSGDDGDDSTSPPLVNLCLYMVSPGRLLEIDKMFLKQIQQEIPVVVVIAKGDTLTDVELASYRSFIRSTFQNEKIMAYSFDNTKSTGDGATTTCITYNRGRRVNELLATICRDGYYPWGTSETYNQHHSDLLILQNLLLSQHIEYFIDYATERYNGYKMKRLQRLKLGDKLKYAAIIGLLCLQLHSQTDLINSIFEKLPFITPLLEAMKKSAIGIFQFFSVRLVGRQSAGGDDDVEDAETKGMKESDDNEQPISTNGSSSRWYYHVLGNFGIPSKYI